MLREHVESIRSSLVVADSHAASMRIHRRIQNGTLRRLLSGVYIPTALFGPVRKLLTVCLCGCCPGRLV